MTVQDQAIRPEAASPGEFAADPLVAPRWVLTGQAQDRITDVLPGGWAAWRFPRVGPLAGNLWGARIRPQPLTRASTQPACIR